MEMYISLSHEIRIETQDATTAPEPVDKQKQALDNAEKQRLIDEYGIDATQEEIDEKEKERIDLEKEKAEENKTAIPKDHGQKKFDDESELNATKIQDVHDGLTHL